MRKLIGITLALLYFSTSFAVTKNDFKYNANLKVTGDHPVYKLILPFDVYQGVKQSNLDDIRIFNSDGVVLPHAVRNIKTQKKVQYRYTALAIFPVRSNGKNKDGNLSIKINKNSKGTIVNIDSTQTSKKDDSKISMYIIDASNVKFYINSLKLDWRSDSKEKIVSILVEKSNDLVNWKHVNRDTLTKLSYQGHQFNRNAISLNGTRAKYFRLSWENTSATITINSIKALHQTVTSGQPPKRHWRNLEAVKIKSPAEDKNHIYFKSTIDAYAPIDRVAITLPYRNMTLNTKLLRQKIQTNRNRRGKVISQHKYYQLLWSGLLYKVKIKNNIISNRDIPVNLSQQREFYFKVPIGTIPDKLNKFNVKVSWIPNKLLFLAQGSGPYTLAYGSKTAGPSRFNFETLANLIKSTHKNSIQGVAISIDTPTKVSAYKDANRDSARADKSTRWILWAVLLIGVGFLGFMTRKITLQMKENAD